MLYVDTDVLFLRPMDDIWALLKAFNSSQLAAMAPEHEVPKIGWYSRFARHPFYGVTGVNSGVMLMNLTRIRKTLFKVRASMPSSKKQQKKPSVLRCSVTLTFLIHPEVCIRFISSFQLRGHSVSTD